MLGTYILNLLLLFLYPQQDTLKDFRHQLSRDIQRNLRLPPETDSAGKCYHYTELLKVTINEKSHIVTIEFSDSATQWLINGKIIFGEEIKAVIPTRYLKKKENNSTE